ncbi:MAG TPA: SemiSWEET transporter [Rhizomicrobium sp.]|jgi:MtN3 and saliva related transmembrane protein|nr:SemiSWEET transporter [Rhizomicrobium sp.]
MSWVTILGALAAIASTVSFTPQAVKIIRTRQTKDISAGMYAITVAAFALWCAYGVLQGQWPLIASNSICLLLSGFILMMKLLPRRAKEKVADAVTPDALKDKAR